MPHLPPEAVGALSGLPVVGTMDQAFVLVTVDPDGVAHICLLSRAEITTGADAVRLVVTSRKTSANLVATRRATLVVVADDAAHYAAMRVERLISDEGALAVELRAERVRRDDLGLELHPIRYRVEQRLELEERWDRNERLLARLEGGPVTAHPAQARP